MLPATLSREAKITALSLLKNYYDEGIFTLLVRRSTTRTWASARRHTGIRLPRQRGGNPAPVPDGGAGETGAARSRGAVPHGHPGAVVHRDAGQVLQPFPEDELRTEILRAINAISPSAQQVLELNHAVFTDPKQSEAVKGIAAEALVEAERYTTLKDVLPRSLPECRQAAFAKMLQTGSQEVLDLPKGALSPAALGAALCVYALKSKNPQANYVLETLQESNRQTILTFLNSLSQFQGRLRYPTRIFRLLLVIPYADMETEALVGDFLKKSSGR